MMSWSLNKDGQSPFMAAVNPDLRGGTERWLGRSAGARGVEMSPGKCCHPFDSDFFTLFTIKFSSGS